MSIPQLDQSSVQTSREDWVQSYCPLLLSGCGIVRIVSTDSQRDTTEDFGKTQSYLEEIGALLFITFIQDTSVQDQSPLNY